MACDKPDYRLDDQIGFLLRQANQRHTAIFARLIPAGLTPTQFAALARLGETGCASQNELGRQTSMDIATVKGVVDRLRDKSLIATAHDPKDKRRTLLSLTSAGKAILENATNAARSITAETLKPLSESEQKTLLHLLSKIC